MTMTDAAISENHPHYQLRPGTILYRRGVQHDADGRAERLGGERVAELGADNAGVAVGTGDLAPDDADPGAADLLLGLVDVGDLLAEVEVRGVRVVDALDLDEAGRGVRDVAGALVGQVASPIDIQSVVVPSNISTMAARLDSSTSSFAFSRGGCGGLSDWGLRSGKKHFVWAGGLVASVFSEG